MRKKLSKTLQSSLSVIRWCVAFFTPRASTGCHPQGGGEVLGFATQDERSAHKEVVSSLSGVIATSPLIRMATPASKIQLWVGGKLSNLFPWALIPTDLKPEVSPAYLNTLSLANPHRRSYHTTRSSTQHMFRTLSSNSQARFEGSRT